MAEIRTKNSELLLVILTKALELCTKKGINKLRRGELKREVEDELASSKGTWSELGGAFERALTKLEDKLVFQRPY